MPRTIRSTPVRDFGRIAPFTDAVVAVALTALVLPLLDIRIDEPGGWSAFFDAYGSELAAFFYGFFIIAVYWTVHHKIWGMARTCTVALLWANLLWLLGIVLLPFGTVALNENEGEAPVIGAQIFLIANLITSVGLGLIIYFIANDPQVADGSMAPQPLVWSMRYAYTWAVAWLAVALFASSVLSWLWVPGVMMSLLSRLVLPSQRAWLRDHPSPQPPHRDSHS